MTAATKTNGLRSGDRTSLVAALRQPALDRFLGYVRVGTEASRVSESTPTSPGQLVLARHIVDELRGLGLACEDVDAYGHVYASMPGSSGYEGPGIGLVAHVDTSPDAPGGNVQPGLVRAYDGGTIARGHGSELDPASTPELEMHVGHDLVTSDGATLLGTDDKAGIAEIVTAIEYLSRHPELPRPAVKLAFTPDEEVGRGVRHFDLRRFGADLAYTLDAPGLGDINDESFHGVELQVTFHGVAAHPGYAKHRMVNSVRLAARLVEELRSVRGPEGSTGREGYVHPFDVIGTTESTTVRITCRDLDAARLEASVQLVARAAERIARSEPGAALEIREHNRFENMARHLQSSPALVETARAALEAFGIAVRLGPIRGTTDGARLSALGLPTPNIANGGHDFHARTEWICVDDLALMSAVVVELLGLWGLKGLRRPDNGN